MQNLIALVVVAVGAILFGSLHSQAVEQPQQHQGDAAAAAAYAALLKDGVTPAPLNQAATPAPQQHVTAVQAQQASQQKTAQPRPQCGPNGCPLISPTPRDPSQQKHAPKLQQPSRQSSYTFVRRGLFGRRSCCR